MKEFYKTIAKEARAEFVEKRSRFIATAKPVETEAEAVENAHGVGFFGLFHLRLQNIN